MEVNPEKDVCTAMFTVKDMNVAGNRFHKKTEAVFKRETMK